MKLKIRLNVALFCVTWPVLMYAQKATDHFGAFHVKGSTTVYDLKNKRWYFTDSLDAHQETLPASTFKIVNSLIALQTKVIADENEQIKWDGIERGFNGTPIASWNKDTDLKNAFKNSVVWFYVALAERIGRAAYKQYLHRIHYGNENLTERGTDFWNYGNLGISPVNQIEFLQALVQEKLPFKQAVMRKVKEIMITEKTAAYTIRGKSGWTSKDGKDIGWWVGYIETADNTFLFATRIIKNTADHNPEFAAARQQITTSIMKHWGMLP